MDADSLTGAPTEQRRPAQGCEEGATDGQRLPKMIRLLILARRDARSRTAPVQFYSPALRKMTSLPSAARRKPAMSSSLPLRIGRNVSPFFLTTDGHR